MSADEQRKYRAKNLPRHFLDASLVDFGEKIERELLEISDKQGLYCWGPVGIGKTHLLAAMANDLLIRGAEIVWTTLDGFCAALRSVFNQRNNHDEETVFKVVLDTEHLFLGDLGVGYADDAKVTDFANRVLYRILDYRVHHEKLTFISANKPPYQLERHFDSRIGSRLHMLHILPLTGKDRRKAELKSK